MRKIYDVIINTRFVQKLPWISRSEVTALKEKMKILSCVPFFSSLSKKELEYIYTIARQKVYKAGSFIFKVGEVRDSLVIVKAGKVVIECSDGLERYAVVSDGGYVGEMVLVDTSDEQSIYTVNARCLTDVDSLVIDRQSFERLKKQDLSIVNKILVRLSFSVGKKFVDTKQELQNQVKSNKILINKLNENGGNGDK